MDCHILPSQGNSHYVYILHGIGTNKSINLKLGKHLQKKGFTTFLCNGNSINWDKTVKDYNNLITHFGHPSIVIGTSMGGAQAISIASQNALVKKVFSFAAPYDVFFENVPSNVIQKIKEIQPIAKKSLPSNNVQCSPQNLEKYYISHNPRDKVVPYAHFEKLNKSLFGCIPEDQSQKNRFIIRSIMHVSYLDDKRSRQWIEKNIEGLK